MRNWPPKDWRALIALLLSAGGAMALTVFVWWLSANLLPNDKWDASTEADRAHTLRWVAWGAMIGIVGILLGLGMAINRRSFKGNIGGSGFDFEGGEGEPTPEQAARKVKEDVNEAADRAVDEVAAQVENPDP